MKDYWYIGAAIGSSIIVIGGLFYFWDPITSTLVGVGSTVRDSMYSFINYFTGRGPGPGSDGGDSGSIVIGDYNDTDSVQDLSSRILNSRLPDTPSTPIPTFDDLPTDTTGNITPTNTTGSITPTPGNTTFVGDSTPRFRAPELKFSYSGGGNPWDLSSTLNSASTQNLLGAGLDRSQVLNNNNVEQITSAATSSSSNLRLDTNVSSGNSTVQNSPILSRLNSLDSSKFSVSDNSNIEVPSTSTNTNMSADSANISTEASNLSSQIDLGSPKVSTNTEIGNPKLTSHAEVNAHISSEASKATDELIASGTGPKIFTSDFEQSASLIFFLLDKISSPFINYKNKNNERSTK